MMKTIHIDPAEGNTEQQISTIKDSIEGLLDSDKTITVTVADKDSTLSAQQAADRIGFSRQHVRRLIEAGELEAQQLPNSTLGRFRCVLSGLRGVPCCGRRACGRVLPLARRAWCPN